MRVELPYPLSTNAIWRRVGKLTLLSKDARQWKLDAQAAMAESSARMIAGRVCVDFTLHPRMTKTGASKRTVDLDNACKLALDSMQGVLFADDSQIDVLTVRRGEPRPGGMLAAVVTELEPEDADA